MSTLRIPKDLEVLRLCQTPRTRYEVMKHFGDHYPTTISYMERLEHMGLLFVTETQEWQTRKKKKMYLTTSKGRAVLRGHEEAERRT